MKTWITNKKTKITRVLSGRSNAFLVNDSALSILVDTGPEFMRNTLLRNLRILDINNINYLILTHSHFDHAANANKIREHFGARVLIHKSEAVFLKEGENVMINGTKKFSGFMVSNFGKRFLKTAKFDPCPADIEFETENKFLLPETEIKVIHTPGHTEGSLSVIIDNEVALTGDAMIGVTKHHIMPPFGNDINEIINSWGKLLETDCKWFLPSHGSVNTRELVEKEYLRYRNLQKR
jgi:hydroxyacylglutathione hydrolase